MTGPALPGKRPGHGNGRGYGQVQARSCQALKCPRNANRMPQEQSAIGGVRALRRGWLPLRAPAHGSFPDQRAVEENPQSKACRHTGFHIADLVTQDRTLRGIQTEVRDRLQDHAGFGLAPRMLAAVRADTVHRVIGTIIDAGYRSLLCRKPIAHPSCQILVSLLVEAATTNAGLIGDDYDLLAQLVGPETSQFENARNKFELLGLMDVAAVHVDHPVTVEEERAVMSVLSDHGRPARWDARNASHRSRSHGNV